MITEYACKSCGWTFVVGGYTSTEMPLRIATLLVCLDCGTGYRLEYVPSAKAYSFFVQPGPYKVVDRPHSVYLEWMIKAANWIPLRLCVEIISFPQAIPAPPVPAHSYPVR